MGCFKAFLLHTYGTNIQNISHSSYGRQETHTRETRQSITPGIYVLTPFEKSRRQLFAMANISCDYNYSTSCVLITLYGKLFAFFSAAVCHITSAGTFSFCSAVFDVALVHGFIRCLLNAISERTFRQESLFRLSQFTSPAHFLNE